MPDEYQKVHQNTILRVGMNIRYPIGNQKYLHFQLGDYLEDFEGWEICKHRNSRIDKKIVVFLSRKETLIEKGVEIETHT